MNSGALDQIPFFVYGTLIPGQPNDHLWRDGIKRRKPAVYTNGNLYDMGYYPMLIEERGGTVNGKLISVASKQYKDILIRIDNLEGYDPKQSSRSSYRRVRRTVMIEGGQAILSWLYVGRQEFSDKKQVISGGDWVKHAAQLRIEMDNWWETVNTVLGLHESSEDSGH
jgi:gamma-glutamylcyclotransferase (GGCT)/AIG2-like uncharacterized protein YtfP